jgi:hypothetical protein
LIYKALRSLPKNHPNLDLLMPSILKSASHPQWDEEMNRKLQELAWDLVSDYPPSGIAADAEGPDVGENSENADE